MTLEPATIAPADTISRGVPEGYAVVPINPEAGHGILRLCLLLRDEPDPGAGSLVTLRDLITGQAFLGCVVDAGGVVHEWIELWVQDVDRAAGSPDAAREALSNASIDREWQEMFAANAAIDGDHLIRTGWETTHAPPTFVDHESRQIVHSVHAESGHPLQLCVDEALLADKGLPSYAASLHRYLHVTELGDASPMVPVTMKAPGNAGTSTLREVTGDDRELTPFNPSGGYLQARRFCPIGYEALVDVLGGASWNGVFHGTTALPMGEPVRGLSQASTSERLAQGHLVLGQNGRGGRLLEIFHLKLRLLGDAVLAVQRYIRETQRPLLNVRSDGFAVRLGEAGTGLPYLWTTRVVLVDPGAAIPLPIEGSDLEYYLRGGRDRASIFRPASGQQASRGECTVRIRETIPERGAIVLDGTLETSERIAAGRHDLVWLRLQAAGGAVNLYASLDPDRAMAAREIRWRTVPQRFGEQVGGELKALEGVPIDRVPFEVVPLMTTPHDLYALGVLAVRTLLVQPEFTLPVALDETLSLARQVAEQHDAETPLPARIQKIFSADSRWLEALGPHRLTREPMNPGEALHLIPVELWMQALAMLVRTFPGIGPDSVCRELGDAVAGGLQKVFDATRDDLADLAIRSRSLIVVDWTANREIHAAIRQCAAGLRQLQMGAP